MLCLTVKDQLSELALRGSSRSRTSRFTPIAKLVRSPLKELRLMMEESSQETLLYGEQELSLNQSLRTQISRCQRDTSE